MIRVLVFGQSGQLARCLAQEATCFANIELNFVGRSRCDLEYPWNIAEIIDKMRPDIVINAAAYTAVDLAESEPDRAVAVNATAVKVMSELTAKHAIPFIHFSTDYVFDGSAVKPYVETDRVAPLGIYGQTKLAGEQAVRDLNPRHVIFRTSWLYSPFGKNFVKTMCRLLAETDEVKVVDDQIGCPTSAYDLAHGVLQVLPAFVTERSPAFGTYHVVSDQPLSWCAFTRRIQVLGADVFGPEWPGGDRRITPISTDQFPSKVKRPAYSVLSNRKVREALGVNFPSMTESLGRVLTDLNKVTATRKRIF
ncbi:dTDP-4-dehydrorhamnose reductase [Thalassospira profundimaris]|uniref:dTDP-4-dehydrorhamnose reductase n=1 Tax=Thalassospira profundimaris TaxID=502049 RepID=A0A367WXJ7_9PROT|nr:dTDP-4-dehydrorhamnose reductase [Thalassospira profundimaris]RCK45440.1 dTDP-4-dehydrorhamnose reductase [Thalassospira profundimaris]